MRLVLLPLILLPLLTWAKQQSTPFNRSEPAVPLLPKSPRAALVTVVEEADLSDIEVSVRQLEGAFNSRYLYPWIFFSTKPLNETFRQVVSAATQALCFYEVIAPVDHSHDGTPDSVSPSSCRRCRARLSPSLFAKEGRMRDYEWFWRVEPGTLFPERIDVDIFRYFEDRGVSYGWLNGRQLHLLDNASNHLPGPDLAHVEKHVHTTASAAAACDVAACTMSGGDGDHADGDFMEMLSGPAIRVVEEQCLGPGSEVGSVAFLQSAGHEALIQHSIIQHCDPEPTHTPGDATEDGFPILPALYHKAPAERGIRTMQGRARGLKLLVPKPTPAQVVSVALSPAALSMAKKHAQWNRIYQDMKRQERLPGLKSGNTVVDERNFTPYYNH